MIEIPNRVLEKALRLRALGVNWKETARQCGYYVETLRDRLDPEFNAAKKRRNKLSKAQAKYNKQNYSGFAHKVDVPRTSLPITNDQLLARKALIPPDTRDLTARLLGDPIPGDMRRAGL
jgi:hypothetical protein